MVPEALDLEDSKIIGSRAVVEIDESQLGKRKYPEVTQKTVETLLSIITARVFPESQIIADFFLSYSQLPTVYDHHTHHEIERTLSMNLGRSLKIIETSSWENLYADDKVIKTPVSGFFRLEKTYNIY
ncbi:hypothetical protein RF11_02430 [Thelohanellus kitauei]|uniref:Uncharacterized protein n=1 Tax=Thelohanellus kitauei TaxID=669202 RepID=A0A0C2MIA6_THEKT|nr:hypothetical protein RF11_02430 [Thelohanellus kitauei]